MTLRSLHSLALRNPLVRRLRTALTGVAIKLGVAAVFATSLVGRAVRARTAELARQGSRASLQITPRKVDEFSLELSPYVWYATKHSWLRRREAFAGGVPVRINQTLPLAEVAGAHRHLEGRKTRGKLLLIP